MIFTHGITGCIVFVFFLSLRIKQNKGDFQSSMGSWKNLLKNDHRGYKVSLPFSSRVRSHPIFSDILVSKFPRMSSVEH